MHHPIMRPSWFMRTLVTRLTTDFASLVLSTRVHAVRCACRCPPVRMHGPHDGPNIAARAGWQHSSVSSPRSCHGPGAIRSTPMAEHGEGERSHGRTQQRVRVHSHAPTPEHRQEEHSHAPTPEHGQGEHSHARRRRALPCMNRHVQRHSRPFRGPTDVRPLPPSVLRSRTTPVAPQCNHMPGSTTLAAPSRNRSRLATVAIDAKAPTGSTARPNLRTPSNAAWLASRARSPSPRRRWGLLDARGDGSRCEEVACTQRAPERAPEPCMHGHTEVQ